MLDDLLAANHRFASAFPHGNFGPAPARHLAVVTCMDCRIDVAAMLGLAVGDAHVIRNAGGRVTDDVVRSLIVSIEVLGTTSVAVIQHTECGMAKLSNAEFRDLVRERRGVDTSSLEFFPIGDHHESIAGDVAALRASPYLPPDLEVHGLLYDIRTGTLTPVGT